MSSNDYIRSPDNQFYDRLSAPVAVRPTTFDSELEEAIRRSAEVYEQQCADLEEVMLLSVKSYEQEQLMLRLIQEEDARAKEEEQKKRRERFAKLVPVFSRLWRIDSENRDVYESVLAFIEAYKANEMDFIEVDREFMDRLNKVSTSIRLDNALMEDLKTCFIL